MKKVLLSIAFLFLAQTLFSQKGNQDDYSISINGNSIATTNNFKQQAQQFRKSASKQIQKEQYVLLQFVKTPTIEEQQKLKEQGATLINSLSKNVYYALVKPDFYNRTSFSKNIRTSITVAPEYKLDPSIAKGTIPDYATEGGTIKIVVSYFKGMDAKSIATDLKNLNIKESKNFESFNEIHLKLPKSQLLEIAKLNWVQNIELIAAPVQSDNKPGVSSHKVNVLNSTIAGLGYALTGKGVKIGIWDSNIEKHKDHTGRVVNKEYEDSNSHGDHVFGTIGGAGLLDPKAKGMAPEVKAYTWNFNTQSNGLPVYVERANSATDDGIELTSNSYGIRLTAPGFNTFRYDSGDRGDDNVTIKFPYLLNVYSNGNDQGNNSGGFNTSSKNSKNALHVAANDPNDIISNYSSFGPTIDGRLVPQIAAVGTEVYSLDYNNSYQFLSGTSMATPGVSGTLALLYERYKNIYGGAKPIASLMKALVSNTAKDVGNPGPDYKYGFGNLNGLRAVKAIDNVMFYTSAIANGASFEKDIVVPSGLTNLKVMLAYTDLPATPGATKILINDLDIKIVKNGTEILPWILNPTSPNANATRGVDNLNNIEQITIDNPDAGTYKIVVTGTNIPLNTQEFAVVYDYVAPELTLTYPIGGEKMDTATTEYIRWDYEGEPKTFTLEYSLDGGSNYTVIANNIPSSARNFLWTTPLSISSNVKVRISAGTKVDASKESFTTMTEPKNLAIDNAACGVNSFLMDWDAIPGAKYEVLKMNGYQFDVFATVTDPNYTFTSITAGEDNWFSVRAIDIASNAVSERVRAVNVEPIASPVLTAVSLPRHYWI
jgi:subtilisin family serine protease